jgi:hypothetical protein
VFDRLDLIRGFDDRFGKKKTRREFKIVVGCSHCNRNRLMLSAAVFVKSKSDF